MDLSRESKIYVMGNGSQSNVAQHGWCLYCRRAQDRKKSTYLTSVNLGDDGHCLYLMCVFIFITWEKRRKQKEKRDVNRRGEKLRG